MFSGTLPKPPHQFIKRGGDSSNGNKTYMSPKKGGEDKVNREQPPKTDACLFFSLKSMFFEKGHKWKKWTFKFTNILRASQKWKGETVPLNNYCKNMDIHGETDDMEQDGKILLSGKSDDKLYF